ncbi:MAG TPA: hybrid sensor histidine kinase/response regulator [Nannocystaceae bacterium]|nr:hybrid sensor histidine kinase/response regulator [Nannocystaceae bacterium]
MPRCLLLVDDDARNLLALEAVLAPTGHRLARAQDGATALRLFDELEPDLVICDLAMPGMDGIEVLARIRAHPTRSHTPVIIVTAHTDRDHRVRALKAGADEFLEKPLDEVILTARLRTLLRLADSRNMLTTRSTALSRLQREQREMTEFLTHDLKLQLERVESRVALVGDNLQAAVPESVRLSIADARAAAHKLHAMFDDLLWVSQIEQIAVPVRRRPIPLDPLIRRVVARFEPLAQAKELTIETPRPSDARVAGDPRLLERVLDNLLDNALRYTPERGRIRIAVKMEHGIEIHVANDGPPIAKSERERIFEKFQRGMTEPPLPGHAGLGLYFCKRAIQAHSGEISVIDVPGWPTCFAIWLPEPPKLDVPWPAG